ncbi:ABC transporter permease [Arachnia propionica]|uniref:ABC transporter permease subunit n=1 Tax=Arachnia propionica TaxID=1750 RepID=A0A3N4DL07_9ACTN|nr:ABC transporter permease subunit [Arachnia propionica]AFN45160.1 ABC transporter, permease protein [Arachnia propionica F0230a]QCT37164.1 ABC transporter permease subunit [Arachnia propionica]QUC10497.1 ABC transporter permease subunit [Arachnia propionica]QUC14814.1 ABC transporter permease subunit [Arachnia propionica]RPA17389.1 ABC transporter permease subunit [Arachnia propionica]
MNWLINNLGQVGSYFLIHTLLSLGAIVAAAVLSVPLARLAVATRRFGGLLLGAFSLLYAVPSLPMLVVIPVILGVPVRSPLNMVIVLTLYGISVLVTQVAEAFRSLPEDVVEAANALGVDPWRRFCQVEMPLAVPVLIAGLRVVAASTVSLVTVGALVGVQSLGTLFTDGFQRQLVESLLTGLGATLLLALVFDLLLVLLGRALTPWLRKRKQVTA